MGSRPLRAEYVHYTGVRLAGAASLAVAASVPQADRDYAPPTWHCPTCHAECKRHSVSIRRVKDVCLDGPLTLEIRVGSYRCTACRKFFRPGLPFAGRGRRYSHRAIRKATVGVQEDKATYTGLPHRLERDFNVSPSVSTGWLWFQEFAAGIDVGEYFAWAAGRFSGQLSVDSVQDKDCHVWFATDPLNRDLILGYHRAEHADSESLTVFLTTLRDNYGVRPQLFTCDGAAVFDSVPQEVWPGVPLQLCHFHVLYRLSYMHLRNSLRARVNRLRPKKVNQPSGRQTPEVERARERYRKKKRAWTRLFRKRRLFLKSLASLAKPKSVEAKEAHFLEVVCRRYKALRRFRQFILDLYALMDSKDAQAAELLRQAFVAKWSRYGRKDEGIVFTVKRFSDDAWFAKLFAFAAWENAQRTTNSTERANRWLRKRQKSHYRIRKGHTITAMLNADLAYRRHRLPPSDPPNRLRLKSADSRLSA